MTSWSNLQISEAIARRAGELSKVGMRRYAAENRLLLYPCLSSNHSAAMEKIDVRGELRKLLCKELTAIREEFSKMANKPIEDWIS